jgi:hypothetical protein
MIDQHGVKHGDNIPVQKVLHDTPHLFSRICNDQSSTLFYYKYLIKGDGCLNTSLVPNSIQSLAKVLQFISMCHDALGLNLSGIQIMDGAW